MDDTENLAKSYAAKLVLLGDIDAAANEMFKIVETTIHDDKEYQKTRSFILQIVKIMDSIDPEYNHAVAVAYYKLVSTRYR